MPSPVEIFRCIAPPIVKFSKSSGQNHNLLVPQLPPLCAPAHPVPLLLRSAAALRALLLLLAARGALPGPLRAPGIKTHESSAGSLSVMLTGTTLAGQEPVSNQTPPPQKKKEKQSLLFALRQEERL
jgi:hypothetical protein